MKTRVYTFAVGYRSRNGVKMKVICVAKIAPFKFAFKLAIHSLTHQLRGCRAITPEDEWHSSDADSGGGGGVDDDDEDDEAADVYQNSSDSPIRIYLT